MLIFQGVFLLFDQFGSYMLIWYDMTWCMMFSVDSRRVLLHSNLRVKIKGRLGGALLMSRYQFPLDVPPSVLENKVSRDFKTKHSHVYVFFTTHMHCSLLYTRVWYAIVWKYEGLGCSFLVLENSSKLMDMPLNDFYFSTVSCEHACHLFNTYFYPKFCGVS